MCRAKKEQSNPKGSADKGSTPPQAATAAKAAKASPSADAKPKQRRKSGLDKTEKDIQHVLYKVIGQVGLTPYRCSACGYLIRFGSKISKGRGPVGTAQQHAL